MKFTLIVFALYAILSVFNTVLWLTGHGVFGPGCFVFGIGAAAWGTLALYGWIEHRY